MSTKVDNLSNEIEKHGSKIDDIRHKISFIKGAFWVFAGMVGFAVVVATIMINNGITLSFSGSAAPIQAPPAAATAPANTTE
ncbi:MAG: hypothetical protein ACYCZU_06235 [Devosia sp.]